MAMHSYPYIWNYLPLVLQVLVALGLACGMVGASYFIGKHKNSRTKASAYECGMDPIGDARGRFTVRFYMVAMLFILFDIEMVFLYPFAVSADALGMFGLVEIVLFIATVGFAYAYVWRRGGLDWN